MQTILTHSRGGVSPPFEIPSDFISRSQLASYLGGTVGDANAIPMPVCPRIYLRSEVDAWDAAGRPPLRDWHRLAPRRPHLHAEEVRMLARLFAAKGGAL